MDYSGLSVVGLSEERWPRKGEIMWGNYTMLQSEAVKPENGVAVVLKNNTVKRVTKVEYYIDRLIFVKISTQPADILIMQVYMPTPDQDDEEIETMHEKGDILHQERRGQLNAIEMEDFNGTVEEGSTNKMAGTFGLGEKK